jgi:peroxiredoxin family protein
MSGEQKEKVAMIVHSGEYDRVSYALSIAKVASALGMEVYILFTYGGLRRLVKGQVNKIDKKVDKNIEKRIEQSISKKIMPLLSEDIVEAKKLGLKIYACVGSMGIMNISKDDLIEDVDQIMGLAAFLDISREAITYYI